MLKMYSERIPARYLEHYEAWKRSDGSSARKPHETNPPEPLATALLGPVRHAGRMPSRSGQARHAGQYDHALNLRCRGIPHGEVCPGGYRRCGLHVRLGVTTNVLNRLPLFWSNENRLEELLQHGSYAAQDDGATQQRSLE